METSAHDEQRFPASLQVLADAKREKRGGDFPLVVRRLDDSPRHPGSRQRSFAAQRRFSDDRQFLDFLRTTETDAFLDREEAQRRLEEARSRFEKKPYGEARPRI